MSEKVSRNRRQRGNPRPIILFGQVQPLGIGNLYHIGNVIPRKPATIPGTGIGNPCTIGKDIVAPRKGERMHLGGNYGDDFASL